MKSMTKIDNNMAADIVRAHKLLLYGMRSEEGWHDELRDLLRRRIAGLSPADADAALVDLFREIDVLDNTMTEMDVDHPFDTED
jgi:hypothetical protein